MSRPAHLAPCPVVGSVRPAELSVEPRDGRPMGNGCATWSVSARGARR